jgi:hypothetical protein
MSAIFTRRGTSSHGAWCEDCQDGIRGTTKAKAKIWKDKHNKERHEHAND